MIRLDEGRKGGLQVNLASPKSGKGFEANGMKGFERRAGIVTADQTLLKILQTPVVGTAIL